MTHRFHSGRSELGRTRARALRYISSNELCSMKSYFLVLPLLAILGITLWWAVSAWNAVDVEMSIHGYIAMILGIVFSLVIGCGLMALMFYSSRHGYDDMDGH
jgi:hypothetical protein